jgi:NitT/TauT family transport system substrate-binding protein
MLQILLLILIFLLSFTGALAQDSGLKKVIFIPQWVPQAQFAGFYVAQEKGFYRQQGLEVTILRGGPDKPPSEWLEKGRADFGTMFLTTAIARRARGSPLVNVAQLVQRCALLLVAKKAAGINVPQDLNGKKVGLWGPEFQIQPRAFFRRYGLTVKEVPQGATLNLFLRGGVDAASAMWYNEYHLILNAGVDPEELTTFFFADHGLNFPEDGIYCLEATWSRDPDRCARFVQASLKGWRYALDHPKEALDLVMKYVDAAHEPTNRVHQQWMLTHLKDLIQPPEARRAMGSLGEEAYGRVARAVQEHGLISEVPSFKEFFKDCGSGHEK